MKGIYLRMNEQNKYEIIKDLVDKNGNKNRAAKRLNCTRRTINRLIKGYKNSGKEFFVHGNRNRKPLATINEETRNNIVDLYLNKYYDANFTHFTELLSKYESINYSVSTIKNILFEKDIISPKANKSTKKKLKKKLNANLEKTSSKKEKERISYKLLELEESHPRRPRAKYQGEIIQMDASVFKWFGDINTQLHAAIDDATGMIVGAYFDYQETLNGYYNVTHQILSNYGIPYMFFTDRRTVFEYKQKKNPSLEKDTFTQFAYACHQLGIELQTSSVAQAKGRIERLFETLQSRLPVELRLAGVTSIDEANKFLESYLNEFNQSFSLRDHNIKSVFEPQVDKTTINQTLAIISHRKTDSGHCIKYLNKHYKLVCSTGFQACYLAKTPVTVIRTFDSRLLAVVDEDIYDLVEISIHEKESRYFDKINNERYIQEKPRYIPPMKHPWKAESFDNFIKSNIKHYDYSFEQIANSQMYVYQNQ